MQPKQRWKAYNQNERLKQKERRYKTDKRILQITKEERDKDWLGTGIQSWAHRCSPASPKAEESLDSWSLFQASLFFSHR